MLALIMVGGCTHVEFDESLIHGWAAPGFEPVAQAFRNNFACRGELGAACAIYYRGEKVVDLWGGYRVAKTRAPWQEDTMVLVFSTTKGIAASAMAVAHSRGLFDLDRPVAAYWPEFAQNGKEAITVRQLLAHEAGLSAIDERLDLETLADLDLLAQVIARQAPAWTPGTKHGYHGLSLGWYENELIRRTDPQHRSIGQFVAAEIAEPLDIELYIGLPPRIPVDRVATIKAFRPYWMLFHLDKMPVRMVLSAAWPWSLTRRSLGNPRMGGPGDLDSPAYRAVEFPSANGIGTARAIAKLYGILATGGGELGITPETMRELTAAAVAPPSGLDDAVLKADTLYSVGFTKPCPAFPYSPNAQSFGSPGAGGSIAFADPDAQVGFAYVTNKMGFYLFNDPRHRSLLDATYRCVGHMQTPED